MYEIAMTCCMHDIVTIGCDIVYIILCTRTVDTAAVCTAITTFVITDRDVL